MSLDGMKTEHHITPRGWIMGAQAIFGPKKDAESKRPDDALATFEEHICQESETTPEETTWLEIWRRDGVSDAALTKLFDQFGYRARNVGSASA
jgi:hypothetical protein